jgi:hypothetical protein
MYTTLTDICRRLSVRGAVWKLSGFSVHNSSSMGIQGKRRSGDSSCISVAAVSQSLSEALAQGEQRLFFAPAKKPSASKLTGHDRVTKIPKVSR